MKQKLIMSTAMVVVVSACSSTGLPNKVVISTEEQAARNFANVKADGSAGTQDAGGAVAAGKTLTARSVGTVAMDLDYANNTTGAAKDAETVTVRRNADGELTMTIGDFEQAFTSADRQTESDGSIYGYETDGTGGNYTSLYSGNGELDELLSAGNGYVKVLNIQTNQLGDADQKVFAVVGTETRDGVLADLPTATYTGRTRTDVYSATGFQSNSESRTKVRSDLTMTADFGAGEISGEMSNITLEEQGFSGPMAVDGTMSMDKTTFDINGFAGSLTASSELEASTEAQLGGSYSGAFYGPEAEEVAGTLRLNGTSTEGGVNGIGYFTGTNY